MPSHTESERLKKTSRAFRETRLFRSKNNRRRAAGRTEAQLEDRGAILSAASKKARETIRKRRKRERDARK